MNDNIYDILWKMDKENNGCSVSVRLLDGEWEKPDANILLDEQVITSGKRDIDLAKRPLFYKVDERVFEKPTYKTFISLLNNYIVNYRLEETITDDEEEEINNFLDIVMKTKVMVRAWKYIEEISRRKFEESQFREILFNLWFQLYTNYYNGRSTRYCSGFEHVFVGEGQYDTHKAPYAVMGEISGYHNWIKFYFDENKRKVVDYRGYVYDLQGTPGHLNPNVVTLQMMWKHMDIQGNVLAELFKKIGGFFVGTSPECDLALGTVAYFENLCGIFSGDRQITTISNDSYTLILYRNIQEDGRRGDHIRSFYPEYKSEREMPEQGMGQTRSVPVSRAYKNDGVVMITRSLVNPEGPDEGKEWVELKNKSTENIDLSKWELRDKSNRPESLSGTLAAGETKRFVISRASYITMQLGNGGGVISVVNQNGETISSVAYSSAASGQILEFNT